MRPKSIQRGWSRPRPASRFDLPIGWGITKVSRGGLYARSRIHVKSRCERRGQSVQEARQRTTFGCHVHCMYEILPENMMYSRLNAAQALDNCALG